MKDDPPLSQAHALYGQLTAVSQWHPHFTSPYSGANSLKADGRRMETTVDITLFMGWRLGQGTELWVNPEIDQGFGLSNTLGMAGYPSGEAYKIGANRPYLRIPRAFVRHVVGLGGNEEKVEAAANQLAGSQPSDNLTLTIGKFSVVDIFDTNSYAHDPRTDFLNWSIIESGAFDYAADPWGFTFGAAVEWNRGGWTLRGGVFQQPQAPNSKVAGLHTNNYMLVGELETRHEWLGRPGTVKLLGFVNRARMGSYRDAVERANRTGETPDTALVRHLQSRPGVALNVEQELSSELGAFLRASLNDGGKEAFAFTEINKSLAAGLSLKGDRWGRPADTLGLAAVVNRLSGAAREYFAAGGMGILIGDGALNYRPERIVEAYYSLGMGKGALLSLDYQHVANPAYNADRGPVNVFAARLHLEL